MPNIVLFGAPGAGKGTLAKKIKKISPVIHISTGDLFRANIKEQTPIGIEAQSYINDGKLVPDSVVIGMVKDRINQEDVKANGFMLDGFPRTQAQALSLDEFAKIDHVLVFDIAKELLKQRIVGRWNCPQCGRIYNIFVDDLKPKEDKICDDCHVALSHRSDDNEETFEKRWNTYISQSSDVISYYDKREGLVKHVDASRTLSYTNDEIGDLLK